MFFEKPWARWLFVIIAVGNMFWLGNSVLQIPDKPFDFLLGPILFVPMFLIFWLFPQRKETALIWGTWAISLGLLVLLVMTGFWVIGGVTIVNQAINDTNIINNFTTVIVIELLLATTFLAEGIRQILSKNAATRSIYEPAK